MDESDEEMVDTDEVPGLILLNPPTALLATEPAFHCYLPPNVVTMAIATDDVTPLVEEDAFQRWLASSWGVLGLLAPVNVSWFRHPARFRPLLEAVTNVWGELLDEGERYTVGSVDGQSIWSVHSNLKYVLANMGVSSAALSAPLPRGGLSELISRTAQWDGVPTVERWD